MISGDAYDGTAHTIELALLEKELSRGVLEAYITPESVMWWRLGDGSMFAVSCVPALFFLV